MKSPKTAAIKKKTAERFEKNDFAHRYKEKNEGKERARAYATAIPSNLKRK